MAQGLLLIRLSKVSIVGGAGLTANHLSLKISSKNNERSVRIALQLGHLCKCPYPCRDTANAVKRSWRNALGKTLLSTKCIRSIHTSLAALGPDQFNGYCTPPVSKTWGVSRSVGSEEPTVGPTYRLLLQVPPRLHLTIMRNYQPHSANVSNT